MADEIGIFSFPDAQKIYDATVAGTREFKEHTRPPAKGGGGSKHAARLMASWSSGVVSCEIYTMDGITLTYKETVNVYDPLSVFAALGTDDWMYCTLQAGKYYAADPAGCPGSSPLIADPPETQPEAEDTEGGE